jgi:hypothetical protein
MSLQRICSDCRQARTEQSREQSRAEAQGEAHTAPQAPLKGRVCSIRTDRGRALPHPRTRGIQSAADAWQAMPCRSLPPLSAPSPSPMQARAGQIPVTEWLSGLHLAHSQQSLPRVSRTEGGLRNRCRGRQTPGSGVDRTHKMRAVSPVTGCARVASDREAGLETMQHTSRALRSPSVVHHAARHGRCFSHTASPSSSFCRWMRRSKEDSRERSASGWRRGTRRTRSV